MVPRPVSVLAKNYPAGWAGYPHKHRRAQLLYAQSGAMRLTTALGSWIIPAGRAVWIPAEYTHQTGSISPLEMRTLYIDVEKAGLKAPSQPSMLNISRLLHELILRLAKMPVEYDEEGQEGLLVKAFLGEIDWKAVHPVSLPSLKDRRLKQIERAMLRNPSRTQTIEAWARQLAISPRTLTRLLKHETDLTFQRWRDQIHAYIAIPMLMEKIPQIQIADAMGYATAWAFTAMFKRVTGIVPSRYIDA